MNTNTFKKLSSVFSVMMHCYIPTWLFFYTSCKCIFAENWTIQYKLKGRLNILFTRKITVCMKRKICIEKYIWNMYRKLQYVHSQRRESLLPFLNLQFQSWNFCFLPSSPLLQEFAHHHNHAPAFQQMGQSHDPQMIKSQLLKKKT